jgi:hypothetical protein
MFALFARRNAARIVRTQQQRIQLPTPSTTTTRTLSSHWRQPEPWQRPQQSYAPPPYAYAPPSPTPLQAPYPAQPSNMYANENYNVAPGNNNNSNYDDHQSGGGGDQSSGKSKSKSRMMLPFEDWGRFRRFLMLYGVFYSVMDVDADDKLSTMTRIEWVPASSEALSFRHHSLRVQSTPFVLTSRCASIPFHSVIISHPVVPALLAPALFHLANHSPLFHFIKPSRASRDAHNE